MSASRSRTVSLALIVRNEAAGIAQMVPRIGRSDFDEIFAIDGNSTDNTVPLLAEMGIVSYRQTQRGLGAAMMEARERTTSDALIYFHPDGNESPDDLPRMADMLRKGADFVVASRMIAGAVNEDDDKFFKWRKWANNGFALLANILFSHGGNRTSDVTNGFRGMSVSAYDQMNLTSLDLTMDYQMVIRALKLGIPITEFPTTEGQRVAGGTNFASFATGKAELKLVWREVRMGLRTADAGHQTSLPLNAAHAK
jgi:glycosyltransferase involved in cell wall biosynthesis